MASAYDSLWKGKNVIVGSVVTLHAQYLWWHCLSKPVINDLCNPSFHKKGFLSGRTAAVQISDNTELRLSLAFYFSFHFNVTHSKWGSHNCC